MILVFSIFTVFTVFAQGQKQVAVPQITESVAGESKVVQNNIEKQIEKQNLGEKVQIKEIIQTKVQPGVYSVDNQQQLEIQVEENNKIRLKSKNVSVKTSLDVIQEQTQTMAKLKLNLSDGRKAEIKIMPETASQVALERLRLKVCTEESGCTIELKEVGEKNQTRAVYEIQAQKEVRVLGIFKARAQLQTQIDTENGEIVKTKRPWWMFLVFD